MPDAASSMQDKPETSAANETAASSTAPASVPEDTDEEHKFVPFTGFAARVSGKPIATPTPLDKVVPVSSPKKAPTQKYEPFSG